MRQLVYQVCYTRYHVSFYLWLIGSVLKHCKVPKYYDHDCCLYLVYCNHHNLRLEPVVGFFIKKSRIIHFIFSDRFSFLVVLNKRKNKSIGNSISKTNKDCFFIYKELVKNDILFSKGMTGRALEMGTRWGEHI